MTADRVADCRNTKRSRRKIILVLLGILAQGHYCAVAAGRTLPLPQDDARLLAGFEPSEIGMIEDGQPFSWSDEVLMRLVYRAPKVPADELRKLSLTLDESTLAALIANPSQRRLSIFNVRARLHSIERAPPRAGAESELPEAYLCTLTLSGRPLRAVTHRVPQALLDGGPLDEPVGLVGFFARLQPESPSSGIQIPLFVAERLTWFPQAASAERGVLPGHLILARHGFDVGLIDLIRDQNRQPIKAEDRPAFNGMLRAAARVAGERTVAGDDSDGMSLLDLLSDSEKQIGAWVDVEANVKRLVGWNLSGGGVVPDETFYQMDVFIPLKNDSVRLRGNAGQEVIFRGRFPVTCHVPASLVADSDWVGRRVRIRGFFYRLWSYETALSDERGLSTGQLSPLILAVNVSPIVVDESQIGRWLTATMGALLVLVVVLVGVMHWLDRRNPHGRELPDQLPSINRE